MSPSTFPATKITVDVNTKLITSLLVATPDSVYAPTLPAAHKHAHRLTKITISNVAAVSTGTVVQVWVGVRYASGAGGSDWVALGAPELYPGESAEFEPDLELRNGDEVVSYADVADIASVTYGIEAL